MGDDGHKWFVSNGSVADIILLFAETNPEGARTGTPPSSSCEGTPG